MKFIAFIATLGLSALLAAAGCAAVEDDHKSHHPAAVSPVSKDNANVVAVPQDANAKMDGQIKAMRDIHEKMMRATSTDERKKLKAEHSKAMQDGMAMMKNMPVIDEHAGHQDMKDMADMSAMKCDMKDEMACCKKEGAKLNLKDDLKCDMKNEMACCKQDGSKLNTKDAMKCDMKDGMKCNMKEGMKCCMNEGMKCCSEGDMKCDMKEGVTAAMPAKHQMMEKRMEMMETMMQMMMDRMINDDYDAHQTSVKK